MPPSQPNKPKRMETTAFIKEVADRLFLPEETVQIIWDTSTQVITEALLREERVIIRRFGAFRLGRTGNAKFKAAEALQQILKERAMEKLGVEMDNEAVLMAKVTGACPSCKAELTSKDPPQCPACGTAPFEKSDRKTVMNKNFGITYGRNTNAQEE
jgi:CO/xanthine dehydrogenase Mo-binding subunit